MKRIPWMLMVSALAVAPGCPVPQDQNTRVAERMERDPVSGHGYWLFVPDTYDWARAAPLIVTCHGSPPWDVANHHIREWKKLAEDNGCIVLAPELGGTDGIVGNGPVNAMKDNEDAILSLISMVGYRYNIDMANIMLTGFSGGGFPTYWVGLRNPDIFSVLALRSCDFCEYNLDGWYSPDAAGKQAIKIYWGEFDPAPIKVQSESGQAYLANRSFSVAPEEIIPGIGHERRPEVAMEFFRANWRKPKPSQPALAPARAPARAGGLAPARDTGSGSQ
ncbi:MAG: hypothetical protein NTV86_12935 [Planctomycetota bacterium]|nr:hypothetical protein [Planctomycetota bacterium]